MEPLRAVYKAHQGTCYVGKAENLAGSTLGKKLRGKVQLILTSPPFPLNNKKRYGNLSGEKYKEWLCGFAEHFSDMLKPDGSIVMELGNSWVKGRPIQSLLHIESLIAFLKNPKANLRLCQQFVCYNPARLPSPAQWVTIERIRFTDSFTHLWWFAKSDYPKADNKRVLRPYSKNMIRLLNKKTYNSGRRPSEHVIGESSFFTNHGGSIGHNFIELESMVPGRDVRFPNAMRIANTGSNDFFLKTCREKKITPHPARMPADLAGLFIEFLTEPRDLVLDPFAGSNTTGYVAEKLGRRWVSIEANHEYALQSRIRFADPSLHKIMS